MTDNSNPLTTVKPTSPGGHRASLQGGTSLRELPWCGKINLRGDPNDARFTDAAGRVLGMPLPVAANTTSAGENGLIFWLGPDEWLLHCDLEGTETLVGQLASIPVHHAATIVTDYYTVLELNGENAGAVLARGCPLDLHERCFKAAQCAQTRFGNASILLYKPGAEPSFQIQVRWSFTEYIWDYLVEVIASL